MPPINQQSSRAGLITALAVFAILFIVSTVFSFQFYGKYQQKLADFDTYRKNYNGIVADGALQSAAVQGLQAAKTESKLGITPSDTLLDVSLKQTGALIGALGGNPDQSPSSVVEGAESAVSDAQKKLDAAGVKVTLPTTGLEADLTSLVDAVVSRQQSVVTLTRQLRDTTTKANAATSDLAKVNAQRDADVTKVTQDATAAAAQLNQSLDADKATITQIQADQAAAAKKASDDAAQAASDNAALKAQIAKNDTAISALQDRLGNRRFDVTNAVIRQSDGKIVRVPNNQTCYINLGFGDQVTPGLTFEVYDKSQGIPAIPPNVTGDEQLPVGKASIEITHVGVTSSECRIVKIEPGQIISEGDPIENLVYDPHTKYNFYVFGNFDLAGNGRPNPNDTNFIKQLVTQWGGKLIDQVNVDTDFVVLGAEPVLPTFSKDDLTPENQDKLQKAQDALDKYQAVVQAAKDLHIPILNQNRFLYYVGYYDQAKR